MLLTFFLNNDTNLISIEVIITLYSQHVLNILYAYLHFFLRTTPQDSYSFYPLFVYTKMLEV